MTLIIPVAAEPARSPVVKKVNDNRRKSPYRDAKFRPWFQAVAALQELQASGETSVTYHTPSHPSFPTLHLQAASLPASTSLTTFTPEALSDEDEIRLARFWSSFAVELAGLPSYKKPAFWRDLSDEASLEWFHHTMRLSGPYMAFTLNLSPEVEAQTRAETNAVNWLSKRIARRLKQLLGRTADLWFGFELSEDRRLHVHGEIQIAEHEAKLARKALRLAAGEWDEVRQHQAKTKSQPTLPWTGYCAKRAIFIRPLSGRLGEIDRAINGDWLFATNNVRSTACRLYEQQREIAIELFQYAN